MQHFNVLKYIEVADQEGVYLGAEKDGLNNKDQK